MAQKLDPSGIVYLRPQTDEAIAVLDIEENDPYCDTRLPPELCDARIEGIPERIPISHPSLVESNSRESTPGPYSTHPRVLRLAFDTETIHKTDGFYFGSLPSCQVKMMRRNRDPECYFCIRYNFNSGALLIVALATMRVGSTRLDKDQSLLVMSDTVIDCGGRTFQFLVEFPDLRRCALDHERQFYRYVAKFGLQNALYMATSWDQDPPIGRLYRSKTMLGQGTFGEVHKAVHINTGELCAIKMLPEKEGEDTLREVEVLSKLSHPNIIEYRDAFKFSGNICIVMELAANDLYKHKDSRKGSRMPYLPLRCIQHIMRQLLLGIEYIHGECYTHRDLKPTNILVIEWDSRTDLPTVKLADFGLAGIKSNLSSLCGTPGYLAPEVEIELARQKRLQERQAQGYKTVHRPFYYDSSVDIWALGKILKELLDDLPAVVKVRGQLMPIPKGPALQLALDMMSISPADRPTASQCLQYPWLTDENLSTGKRDRSPNPDASVSSKRALRQVSPKTGSADAPTRLFMEITYAELSKNETEK